MAILTRGLLAALLMLAACSPAPTGTPGAAVAGAWIRTPPPGAQTAAGYALITNTGGAPDRLLGASSPAAASVMLHQSAAEGGTMTMRHVEALAIEPGKSQALEPGGYHLMLVGLKAPLAEGARAPVVLKFERAGQVQADFVVGRQPPP